MVVESQVGGKCSVKDRDLIISYKKPTKLRLTSFLSHCVSL